MNHSGKSDDMKLNRVFAKVGFAVSVGFFATTMFGGESATESRACPVADVYLEGGPAHSIDTGVKVGPNTRIVADISYEAPNGTYYLWGHQKTGDARPREYVYLQDGVLKAYSGNWRSANMLGDGVRYLIDYDLRSSSYKMKVYAGRSSELVSESWIGGVQEVAETSLGIFSFNVDGNWWAGAPKLRIYSFKVYEANSLIRDFVPYGYGALTGLVDRCTGKVYADVRKNATPFKIGMDPASARSVNNTFLNTGYCPNAKTKLEVEFALGSSKAQQRILGCRGEGAQWWLYEDANKKLCRGFGNGSATTGAAFGDFAKTDGRRYKYTVDMQGASEKLECAGRVLYSGSVTVPSAAATIPLGLCCEASGVDTPDNFSDVAIYACKIWEDGTLVRDYEPRTVGDITGLYDLQNETFLTATVTATRQNQLVAGGNIETTGAFDACLLSHRLEAVNTGYIVKPNTRLSIDFSYFNLKDTQYPLGVSSYLALYEQDCKFDCYAGGWHGKKTVGDQQGNEHRVRVDLDLPSQKISHYLVGETTPFLTFDMNNLTTESPRPMVLFARGTGTIDAPTCDNKSQIKLYSFKIYEDDELKYTYYPTCQNGVLGLKDKVTGNFLSNNLGTGTFELLGGGYEGLGLAFAQQPEGGTVKVNKTLTLKAFAPGADGYQWFKNNQLIEGAVSDTLTVDWRKGRPHQDEYRCVARYAIWGYAESSVATVEYATKGLFLVIK